MPQQMLKDIKSLSVCFFFWKAQRYYSTRLHFYRCLYYNNNKKRTISDHLSVCYVYSETASFLFLLIFISLLVWWSCSCSHYEVAHCHYHDHYSFKAALVVMLYRGFFSEIYRQRVFWKVKLFKIFISFQV